MIIFKEVRMRNFRSFGNTWNAVQLDRNKLTLISAPNGSGKSSILMAIEWCLFGKVGNLTKKEIVNQINEKECEVELIIQNSNNGNVYKIQRGINPTYLKIYKNNELVPENSSVKDYQEVINDLTGLNRNVFHRIISINGSSYVPFLSLGQSARREMVEDILEINELRQLNIKNNEALNKVETELNTIKGKIEGLEITVQKIKSDNETNDEADNEKVKTLLDEMAVVLDGKSLKEVEAELYKMRLSKNSLEQNGERLNKEIDFWNADKCPTCGQEIAETLKQEKVSNANKKLKEIAETIEVAGEVIEKTENTLKRAKTLENEIASLLAVKKGNKSGQTIKDLQVTIGELTKELESLKETALYHNTIRKWLKDDGVRSVIISKYLPLFNKTLRKYLTDIGIDVNIELDKMFSATIKKNNGEERTYSSFSAGERARIDLCFLLSWKSLISSNKFVDTSLLFMDEIYDSVLDAEGLESLVNLLYNMDNTNVFFISHREGIEEAFQNRLVIEKEKGFSRIL
jgi:DNA repair exonuclease SbcCD ATPase subunit